MLHLASVASAQVSVPMDTLAVFYALPGSPELQSPLGDSLPEASFRMYDPARKQRIDWGTLGNLGASARPLFFETNLRKGFDSGVHAFDLYRYEPELLRFYRNTLTFSEVSFSQGKTQEDNLVGAQFSHTFGQGQTLSLDYRNMSNIGQYQYQTVKNTNFSVGFWWPIGERYQFFLIHTRNTHRQQENGGLVADANFGSGQFSGPINADIQLPDQVAQSRIAAQNLYGIQYYDFKQKGARTFRGTHTFRADWQQFKFYDTNLKADTLFFDTFWVDQRGIRNAFQVFQLGNGFELTTYKKTRPGRTADLLALGIEHSYIRLHQEPSDSAFSQVFLNARLALQPGDRFDFSAHAALGLFANIGEYQADARLHLDLGQAGKLDADFISQRYPPSLLSHRLYVSQRQFWNNDFNKPIVNSVSLEYHLPISDISILGQTHLVNNYLYFDQNGIAQQTGLPLQVVQLMAQVNLKFGPVHLDNTLALQKNNQSAVLHLPEWFSKNSIYYGGPVFKKQMDLRLGFDFRINSAFKPDAYQPLLWQFHLQDSITQAPYPQIDAFITFKVAKFRFFFRYENLLNAVDSSQIFYQTAYHPQLFSSFRLGINWRFVDSNTKIPGSGTATQGGSTIPPGVGN